jgi:site-specific DNA-methyltransferase (adenine-specific)
MELNQFYNCDCLKYMATVPDKYFELAIVDPPYGIDADLEQNKMAKAERISNGGKWKAYKNTNWDNEIPTLYYFKELFRISKTQIIWGGNYFYLPPCCKWIVWNKIQRSCMSDGEMAWTNMRGQVDIFDMSRADAYINHCDTKIHPTQKPVALYRWLLMNYAKKGDKIFDSHVGSGSNLIACIEEGFEYVGTELDYDYWLSATKRIDEYRSQLKLAF